jgi:hypothetical protein
MIKTHKRINSKINVLYPKHGKLNILRRVCGTVVKKGVGRKGPYLTVECEDGTFRTLSTKKIVSMF